MSRRTRKGGRRRFEIQPGQHRPKNARNGLIFVVLAGLFLFVIYTKPGIPFLDGGGTEIAADIDNGANIRPGYTPVRVQGVEVGQVTSVGRAASGKGVRIAMKIDDGKGVSVRRDATLTLRWRTLLGRNLYVDLKPGSPSAPPLGDDTIALARTSTQTELDEAIEPLDDHGRQAVKTIVNEFDKGFASPDGYRRTVRALRPAMRSLGPGLRALRGTQPGDLPRMIRATSRTVGAVARDEVALGELINSGRVALGVTAARQADLRGLLSAAPGALAETRRTMVRLRSTLDVLDPLARDLRPGVRKLEGSARDAQTVLTAATPLLKDARPTLRALQPAVQDLTKLTTSGNAFIDALDPTLDRLIYPILPWARQRDIESERKNYEVIGPALSSAAGVTALGDRNGPVANFEAGVGEGLPGLSPCKTFLTNEYVAPDEKLNCELAARLIQGLLTGTPPDKVELRGGTVPEKKLRAIMDDKAKLRSLVRKAAPGLAGTTTKERGR